MEKPKASENKAKDVETRQELLFAIPESLRRATIRALQTSSPKQLSVREVNNLCNDLSRLRPISIQPETPPKEKPDDEKT